LLLSQLMLLFAYSITFQKSQCLKATKITLNCCFIVLLIFITFCLFQCDQIKILFLLFLKNHIFKLESFLFFKVRLKTKSLIFWFQNFLLGNSSIFFWFKLQFYHRSWSLNQFRSNDWSILHFYSHHKSFNIITYF
jgi:hypothetical protein